MQDKVYCKFCVHHQQFPDGRFLKEKMHNMRCFHPTSAIIEVEESFFERTEKKDWKHCYELNTNNNCKLFQFDQTVNKDVS